MEQRFVKASHFRRVLITECQTASPGKTAEERRSEIDNLVSSLIDRQRDSIGASPSRRQSGPSSIQSAPQLPAQNGEESPRPQMQSASTQTLSMGSTTTVFEDAPSKTSTAPKSEYITYAKGVQTENPDAAEESEDEEDELRNRKRLSRIDRDRDESIRASLRKEIEEEVKAAQSGTAVDDFSSSAQQRFPLRNLTSNELNAVTGSKDFQSFVERSTKVIERALDENYDVLADYTRTTTLQDSDEDAPYSTSNKKPRSIRETVQLYSDKTRRRMVSDIHFSPHFTELLATSYTKNPSAPNETAGLVLVWNTHAPSRPEYTFTSASDVLTTRFSPFHPNLVIGGCYSGQICLWDTRISGRMGMPVQKTPQSGHLGHAHPVYNLNIVGTTNAHNIITASTDGVICSWSIDMLSQPQEYLELATPPPAKTDDLSPTTMSFPASDPTFFLVGTEEGTIYPCHRYDRAGAKAGVDAKLAYRGHAAPVMSTQFHPSRGPVDLGDLLLSSSSDWSVKLWRVKPAASSAGGGGGGASSSSTNTTTTAAPSGSSTTNASGQTTVVPILDIPREDLVYDARWSPHRPSVFACVTGAGDLEIFDLLFDAEVPVAKAAPTRGKTGTLFRGLNKVAWEERRGATCAVGGLDGVVSCFEVGRGIAAGPGEVAEGEWVGLKRSIGRWEREGV